MKKGITVILALTLALGLGLGGLSIAKNAKSNKEFIADGYILDPADEDYVTEGVDTLYYFSQGAKYKEKYGSQILFKDSSGNDNSIDTAHFLHYNDGSLGAFTKGVIMDVSELSESNYGYYSLTKNTMLVKNGNAYEMKSRGESLNITEYIWKISDTDYMLVSPNISLNLGGDEVPFPDYVQITYVDNGIVRLSHQQGTYQTVAAESKLVTQGGAELNLVGKCFMIGDEPVLSLDDMAIDDTSYIDIDENIDQPNIPTFNVINGKDGANGTDGTDGEKGEIGEDGEKGEEGQEGEEGSEGTAGSEGTIGSEGAIGQDGVEGDMGTEGLAGNNAPNGIAGKDATNAATDANGIKGLDLNPRPTVTTVSSNNGQANAASYDATAGSATMTLSIDDPGDAAKDYMGDLSIKLYNRATGTDLSNENGIKEKLADAVAALQNGREAALTITGLAADTEYELVVSGKYENIAGDSKSAVNADFLRKVFSTSPRGISLEKKNIGADQFTAEAVVNGAIKRYDIIIEDADGNQIMKHKSTTVDTGYEMPVNNTTPAMGVDERQTMNNITSNTLYKARLANVYTYSGGDVNNEVAIDTTDSVIEIRTLKETPYKKKANATDQTVPISDLVPELGLLDKGKYLS